MENNNISEDEYLKWLEVISQRYRQCQVKAAVAVNRDLIEFYWSLGRDIVERGAEKYYGSGFYDKISKDLKEKFKDGKGFSSRNIRYMAKFYQLYRDDSNLPQAVADLNETKDNENLLPQLVANLSAEELCSVPWGHHRMIMDRCKGDSNKAAFFVRKTIQNNWFNNLQKQKQCTRQVCSWSV